VPEVIGIKYCKVMNSARIFTKICGQKVVHPIFNTVLKFEGKSIDFSQGIILTKVKLSH
jgi:hypothetical protein